MALKFVPFLLPQKLVSRARRMGRKLHNDPILVASAALQLGLLILGKAKKRNGNGHRQAQPKPAAAETPEKFLPAVIPKVIEPVKKLIVLRRPATPPPEIQTLKPKALRHAETFAPLRNVRYDGLSVANDAPGARLSFGCICSVCRRDFSVDKVKFQEIQEEKQRSGKKPICPRCSEDQEQSA